MRYAVVIENAGSNFSAYVPDLPGCVATAALRRLKAQSAKRWSSISMGCVRTVHPFRLHRAKWSTSKLLPNKSPERTREG